MKKRNSFFHMICFNTWVKQLYVTIIVKDDLIILCQDIVLFFYTFYINLYMYNICTYQLFFFLFQNPYLCSYVKYGS